MPKPKAKTASAEVDAQLARYREMRDFAVTAEPSGGGAPAFADGLPFVIQKHAATRLHYDFRLGWRGVLKSWACAKGPSYSTKDRRLAVQVEDHPMEYGGFEGTIPKGQYGGGTVMVWDQGTWEPLPDHDFDEGLKKGALKFTLHGEKLEGRWTLVRMGGHAANEAKPNWLLIKEHDGRERPEGSPAITDEAPDSVVTGRSLEAISAAEDHVWQSRPAEHNAEPATNRSRLQQRLKEARSEAHSDAPSNRTAKSTGVSAPAQRESGAKPAGKRQSTPTQSTAKSWLEGAPHESMPAFLAPQLATAATIIPQGSGWLHELKLDGYRVQAHIRSTSTDRKSKREVTLFTRSGLDWTHRMKAVAHALEKLPVEQAVLDGEVVVLDESGATSFSRLQAAFEKGEAATFTFFAFDLLHLNGHNLRGVPLHARKALVEPLVAEAADPLVLYSQHLQLAATQVFEHACAVGAEGILSKSGDSRYVSGRSETWLKLKCTRRQEFVIAGFTLPKDRGSGLGSLLLGYYRDGALVHCGRCGTGFSHAGARELRRQLEPLRTPKPAYAEPLSREAKKDAIWMRPELVCEVQFATWTADGSIRHASFQGLRQDKPAAEVVLEPPSAPGSDPADERDAHTSKKAHPHAAKQASSAIAAKQTRSKKQSASQQPSHDNPEPESENTGNGAEEAAADKSDRPRRVSKRADGRTSGMARKALGGNENPAKTKQPAKPAKPASVAANTGAPRLTHPEKILDSDTGVTKQQLAAYYEAVAVAMLPHIHDRPVSIVRCPDGSTHQCFFQKHAKVGLPVGIGSIAVPDRDNPNHTEPYVAIDTPEALVSLAQLAVLELHPWGSQASALEQPDRLILDLDPDEDLPWSTVVDSALTIRGFLQELGLESFVKTTGGKGLHIVAALEPQAEWPEIRLFSRGIAAAVESSDPKLYLIKMTKLARKGRIFLDWMRNERGATAVAPWSPRARAGMRVAVPLRWDELSGGPATFSVANFSEWQSRVQGKADPWAAMKPQRLDAEVLRTVVEQSAAAEKQTRRRS